MRLLTALTRMWLTRSFKSFQFKNEYDNVLAYNNANQLRIYIHIPFCKNICSFCPYCKEKYDQKRCEKYIEYLIKEIHMIKNGPKKEVTSLYFGGGTPALAIAQLKDIINAVNEHFIITEGIGLELHPDNVTEENLLRLKEAGVTKISIGIQSFQDKFLKILV